MKHGGDIQSFKHLYGGEILDYSSNINPLGPPENLRDVFAKAFEDINLYPDIKYRELKDQIGKYLGCQDKEVIVGNGAVEIINNVSLMFKRVVVFTPCFIEYIERPEVLGREVVKLKLNESFEIDENLLEENIAEGDLIILGNPNNPTGKRIAKEKLLRIHEIVEKKKAFLLLDEAFYEFCPDDYNSIEMFYGSRNVCVIRAATKFFALPGIRLGYAYGTGDMVARYNKIALPWCINTFADYAGREIFKEADYIKESKRLIGNQREYMISELNRIDYLKAFDTDCNFVLVKLLRGTEEDMFSYMIGRGVLVRKASSFVGLDNTFIRLAIKDYDKNSYVINCLREYSKWKP
jgi:threonine-phosphate decarboxylase